MFPLYLKKKYRAVSGQKTSTKTAGISIIPIHRNILESEEMVYNHHGDERLCVGVFHHPKV
jgi:hypothetical protein